MAEEANFGVARLRQAITNQAACGSGQFELSIDSADRLCLEIEDELAALSRAKGVSIPGDAIGEIVPLTTKVMYDRDGGEHKVNFYSFAPESGYWTVNIDEQSDSATHVIEGFRLHRRDSWEFLEEDIRNAETGGACGYYGRETKPCNEDCPANKDPKNPCSAIAPKDVLRRAKALAGVGES